MELQPTYRRITGLSGDKWTLHQLKAIQPSLQQVNQNYNTTVSSVEVGDLQAEAIDQVIRQLIDVLRVSSLSKAALASSVKCMGADLLTDVIRAVTVYQCSQAARTDEPVDNLIKDVLGLGEAIFSSFDETVLPKTGHFEEEQQDAGIAVSRSLATIAALGNNGFEDTATILLQSVLHAVTIGRKGIQQRQKLTFIFRYTRAYLKFSQSIARFHNNRKKLFTSLCDKMLIYAVPLLSHCNFLVQKAGSSEEGAGAGPKSGEEGEVMFIHTQIAPLQKALSELLEGGLFDEKNIDEFATLRLESTPDELKAAEEAANSNRHKNKKAKKNEPEDALSTAAPVSSNVSVAETVSGKNKAYHDTLFRLLSMYYYEAEADLDSEHFASGIAWMVRIYGDKSAALALLASAQSVGGAGRAGSFAYSNSKQPGGLGSDVVNTRKHLIRVFHFSFLMLEALKLHDDGDFSIAQTLSALPVCTRRDAPSASATGASGKKKRRHSEVGLVSPSNAATTEWTSKARRIVREHHVRNEVLAACVQLLHQQSIPNHESLQRYVDRLVSLSAASVLESVSLQKLLADTDPSTTDKSVVQCVHELLTLNLDSVRLVASIDHTTIVDHRLRDLIKVLSFSYHSAFDAANCGNTGERRLYEAKRELFRAVLNVHGELRLMDQLAAELFRRENLQMAQLIPSSSSMLHGILLSRDVASLLTKLLISAPTGQIPQLWSHLAGADAAGQKGDQCLLQIGVVTSAFARALIHAQLHTVRSNISVMHQDPGVAAAAGADGLHEGTVNTIRFLRKLAVTLQTLAASPRQGTDTSLGAELLQHVLLTLSALLRFVAHMHAGTIAQLLSPCPEVNNQSFFEIAMTTVLNNLVALKKASACYGSILKAILSLLLLHSNVIAKGTARAVDGFSAPSQILSKYTRDLLAVDASVVEKIGGGDGLLLEVLEIALSDIRVWSQYIRPEAETRTAESGGKFVDAKHFSALFQAYIRVSRTSTTESGDSSAHKHALSRIRLLLSNAAVADNRFIREALHSALMEEWSGFPASLSTTPSPSACQARCEFVSVVAATLPGDILFSVTALVSELYPVLVQACGILKGKSDSATAATLFDGVFASADVLGGHIRLCRGRIARTAFATDAIENPLSPFLSLVMKLVSEKSSAPGILLTQLLKLLDDALLITSSTSSTAGGNILESDLFPLLCMMLDAFVSHFVREVSIPRDDSDRSRAFAEASLAKVSEFLKSAVLRIGNHPHSAALFEATQAVFHTVVSCYAAALSWKRSGDGGPSLSLQPVATSLELIQELLVENLLPTQSAKSRTASAPPHVSGSALHFVAEVSVVLAQLKGTAGSKGADEPVPASALQAVLAFAASVVGRPYASADCFAQVDRGAEGWLYMLGASTGPLLVHCGVISQAASSDDSDEFSEPVMVDLLKLDSLCRVIGTVVSSVECSSTSTAERLSMAVISLVASIVKVILGARICNCDAPQVVTVLKHALLKTILDKHTRSGLLVAGLCRDLLIYFTEYGRKLLVTSRAGQEKFQAFHDSLIQVAVELFQEIAAAQVARDAQSIGDMAELLQSANTVTLTFAVVIQRQGRSAGARRKNKENDTRSATFRCDLWFDGLLGVVSLSSSHLHLWKPSSHTAPARSATSLSATTTTSPPSSGEVALCNNAASVLLAKNILQVVERFVAVSSSTSLPNLNTAIGAVVQVLTSVLSLLLDIDNNATSATSIATTGAPHVSEALKMNLSSCYHLLCRIFGNIASSQVLEKHIHFIACAVVETLSKASSVTRSFQEIAYPGIYSLFEKCQSRQKTQMFAMLDTQSRTLMTDLHNEFVRSFKFVGK